jgi:hypothetical protein
MSETAIFVIGSIVWAITVAGTVLAGGYLLGQPRRSKPKPKPGPSGGNDETTN